MKSGNIYIQRLRWIAVLPIALVSFIIAGFAFDVFLWILTKLVSDNYFTFMPKGMINTIKAFGVTVAGMYGGINMAPKKKFATGVVLVTINTLSYIIVLGYGYFSADFDFRPISFRTYFWPAMQVIAALSAAPIVCAYFYTDKKRSLTGI
jgi:hypothetical protein